MGPPSRPRRSPTVSLLVGILLATAGAGLLASCGDSTPSRPSASLSRTALPSPSATVSRPTRSPDNPRTNTPTPRPSPTPAPTASATESPAGSGGQTDGSADEGNDVPAWAWWSLGVLVLAVVVAIPLLVRSRRRKAWDAELASASQEVTWFARVLLPQLQPAISVDQLTGGWSVGSGRVSDVQDRLTALAATAGRDADRARATQLRDAVREARERLDRLAASPGAGPLPQELAAIASSLEAALAVNETRRP